MGAFIDKTLETFERMDVAITELRQRVEALEASAEAEKTRPLTEVLEVVREADRSHVIPIGESHYHL